MNTKHLLLAATAAFVASNFMGCKEKEDDFDYTFENCVKSVSSMKINDGGYYTFENDIFKKFFCNN